MKAIWEMGEQKKMTFEEVAEQYKELVKGTAYKWRLYDEAEQICLIALWKAYEQYDENSKISFSYYAKMIVNQAMLKHHHYNTAKKRFIEIENMQSLDYEVARDVTFESIIGIDNTSYVDLKIDFENAIESLHKNKKSIILLTMLGLKNKEIAEQLNLQDDSVRRMLYIARKQLKRRMAI